MTGGVSPRSLFRTGAIALAALLVLTLMANPARSAPLRLAALHPYPRFCAGQELGQQDVRVLRLVFGLHHDGRAWAAPPWFISVQKAEGAAPPRLALLLDLAGLWGTSDTGAPAAHPAPWSEILLNALPALRAAPRDSGAVAILPLPHADPLLLSRLNGSALLPFRSNGAISPPDRCDLWPAGVRFEQRTGVLRYRLTRAGDTAPFTLLGYRVLRALTAELRRGRIDGVLLEGTRLKDAAGEQAIPAGWRLFAEAGTQQIVVRVSDTIRAALDHRGMLALSLAAPRPGLAEAAGPGFAAARAFFLGDEGSAARPDGELTHDALRARQLWLEGTPVTRRLRLTYPDHPTLAAVASRLTTQWHRTLNITVEAQPLPVAKIALPEHAADFRLDVVDLDDGSWQELLLPFIGEKLHDAAPPSNERLARWEERLRSNLPYLPLLENRHFFLAAPHLNANQIDSVCPGCVLVVREP